MPISDLIPWSRKKKTRVPVNVEARRPRASERNVQHSSEELSRWSGLAPFSAFGGWGDVFGPRMDMVEDSEGFMVTVEASGMEKEDIEVTLLNERLTIRGEKRFDEAQRSASAYRLLSARRAFRRSVLLPCQVDAGKVEAALSWGVLTIRLPKAERARGGKQIPAGSG